MSSYIRPIVVALGVLGAPIALANPLKVNLKTLSGLTIDKIFQSNAQGCTSITAVYLKGGNSVTGSVPDQSDIRSCGIDGFTPADITPAEAINARDHQFLQSKNEPTILDFGSPQKTVVVVNSLQKIPALEDGIKRTVWGSHSNDTSNFPQGWTMATLNTIWKRGVVDPKECQSELNADDYSAQYTFPKKGFRFIALYANGSISIFKTVDNLSWNIENDAQLNVSGWQSLEEESDAVLAPTCTSGVRANAGEDKSGPLGKNLCFKATNSIAPAQGQIVSYGWDADDNGSIDITGESACIQCDTNKTGKLRLYVTDQCGCVDTDAASFTCSSDGNSANGEAGETRRPRRDRHANADESREEADVSREQDADEEVAYEEEDDRINEPVENENAATSIPFPDLAQENEGQNASNISGMVGNGDPSTGFGANGGVGQNSQSSYNSGNSQGFNNGMSFGSAFPNSYGNARSSTTVSSKTTPPIFPSFRSSGCTTTGNEPFLWLFFIIQGLARVWRAKRRSLTF